MPRLRPLFISRRVLLLVAAATLLVALVVGLASRQGALPQASFSAVPSASASAAPRASTAIASSSAAATATAPASPTPTPTAGSMSLQELLALLPVAAEDRSGYDRALFPHWIDADGDGCDTRREVLIEEAIVAPTVGDGCSLSGGSWRSLYDGLTFTDPADLQIDHLVALAEAWDSGASAWTTDRRQLFANDLDVSWALIAVSASSNQSKSDRDPADWLPPDHDAWCPYVSAWIAVKARWSLSIDPREHDALADLIVLCPGARMPLVAAPAPAQPSTSPSAAVGCSPAYPTVCIPPPPPDLDCADIAFRAFTVLAPDPHHFDGDHDGIGCEGG